MKLLVQADDYGITRAVSLGIIYGIEKGIIRNTGIFTNMPWFEECAEWIRTYRDSIALGIDLNISTGSALLPHEQIPTITREDGSFFSSSELRSRGMKTDPDDVRKEFSAQIERFVNCFGHSPDYIHPHAVFDETIIMIERELAEKNHVPLSGDFWKQLGCPGLDEVLMPWYIYPTTLENQLKCSLKDHMMSLLDKSQNKEYSVIVGHMGYVDRELLELSSFNLLRMNDLAAVTDKTVLKLIDDRQIRLINYREWQ